MDKYLEIKKMFESKEDKENAIAMSKYMSVNVNTKMYKNGNITMYKNGNIIKLA